MANYNNHTVIAKTYFDLKNRHDEIKKTIENKDIEVMSPEDFSKYLSWLTNETEYVEKSNNVIKNVSDSKWKKDTAKKSYAEVNEKINKLNKLGFYDIISGKSQKSKEMQDKVLRFNDLNSSIFLSEQKGGVINESVRSFKESVEYFNSLKQEAIDNKVSRSFFAFDLETTGGKNLNGVWQPDSITEFSLQEYDIVTGKRIKNHTMIVGLTEDEGKNIYKEIEAAIKDGSIRTNERLRVSAMRYSLYGENETSHVIDEATGLWKIKKFADADNYEMLNLDKIKKGVNLHVEAGRHYEENLINGVRLDRYHIGQALKDMEEKLNAGHSSLVGQNHIGHDMPIIQNQLLKWKNQYKDVTDMFDINLDIDPQKTIDLLGGTRAFIEYNNVSALYPGDHMLDAKKVAGQEYMAKIHLSHLFEGDNPLLPHKAEDDVTALAHLFVSPSEILENNTTVLDHIYKGLEKVDTIDTTLDVNTHILKAKKRAGSYGGKGYINFASDSKNNVYTASDHILGKSDPVSKYVGGAIHENFNVGFGVNKGGFYELNKIQKIDLTDEVRDALGDLAPEYSGKSLYHVQLSMAVTDKYKDSRLGDLKQNFFFKNKKELEGFLSSTFDVVADKTTEGIKIREAHLDKFDIRELQDIQGEARFVDKRKNWQKNQQELFDDALDFQANKILTSRAENTFLRDSNYDKINKALKLENELLDYFNKELKINKENLSQREINQIISGRIAAGESALPLNNSQLLKAQDIIKETLSYEKKINGQKIERTLDSTIDNYSSIMEFISKNKTVLNNIKNEIEERIPDASNGYKQEIFSRVYDSTKRKVAEHIYRNSENTNPAKAMGVLTDKRLQANIHEFKNMYELDFSSLVKNTNKSYVSIEKPESLTNIHKFDISSKSPMYSIIDKATEAYFGKDYRGQITDAHKQLAVEELFATLHKEDKLLRNTEVFDNFRKTYNYKNNKFRDDPVNYLNIADTIVAGMQEVKAKDKFAGIKNLRYSFMKSLEGNDSFIAALNSDPVQEWIGSLTEDIINDTQISFISGKFNSKTINEEIGTIVDKSLLHHYIPDKDMVKKAIGNDTRKEMLYSKGVKDIREYLIDTIKGFSFIEGTEINIQKDGALLITNGGNEPIILNKLPQMKLDNDSGVLYLQVGNQKLQLNKKAQLSSNSNGIKADIGTNISQINEYANSKNIQNIVREKGVDEGLATMLRKINYDMGNLREGPTINNFSGNDIDSNYHVDLSEIKNVLNDLFGEKGIHKDYLEEEYIDKNLKETLKKKLARASFDEKGVLKDLSPDITRDIVKNVFPILDSIVKHGNITQDFLDVVNNSLGFTGQEKKISNYLMAYEGKERPHNSTFGPFDNTQRPPITQSGNAKYLRINDIDEATKNRNTNIIAGNLISNSYADSKTLRSFSGVGNTTTDVMLDIYYSNTSALKILMESNFNKVIKESKTEFNSDEKSKKVFEFIKESVNTFEQERIMDSRTFEDIYGLQTAATQKLSKGTDIKSILKDLDGEELEKQIKLISKHRGDFKLVNDEIVYESAIGLHISRGDGTLKSKGFADLKTSFSSKVKDGVFNFNYYNSSGVKLRDSEINKIIAQNKDKFIEDGKFVESYKFTKILDKILEKESIVGQYVIEDMNALGYAKTMTGGAEKGMTDVLYATTGKYDQNVRKVFENLGLWDTVKTKVLTEEAIDSLVVKDKNNKSYVKKALKDTSFNTVDDLKEAIKKERHTHSRMLFEYALDNKAHLIANDNVIGHANFGQMYQGSLSKAIDLLSKKEEMGGLEGAVQTIVDMINGNEDFKFMENWDLSGKKVEKSAIGVKNIKGRLIIDDNFLTENNRISNLNSTKFNNLLRAIDEQYLKGDGTDSDDRLVRKDVHMLKINEDGTRSYEAVKEIVGAYYSTEIDGKKVILGAQTKENTKIVTDVETQSGVTDEYFTIKKSLTNLKKEKIELESAMHSTNDAKVKSNLNKELLKVKNQIDDAQDVLSSYDGTVKTIKFSDQELSIINRVAITQSNIDQINELIDKGQLDINSIDSLSLKGRLIIGKDGKVEGTTDFNLGNMLKRNADGTTKVYEGEGYRALDWFTDKVMKQQWFDEINDVKLDKKYLELDDYKHLEDVYNYFNNKDLSVGVKKAEEVYQARMAIAARQFNAGSKNDEEIKKLTDKGFEKIHINEITLDTDMLSTKNLVVDLGEDFQDSGHRYLAMPGTGKAVMDEEIRKGSHSKFTALKHKYDEFLSVKGSKSERELQLMSTIKSLSDDVMTKVDEELFNKNAILHNMSKVEMTTPSYRNKLSGFIGSHFDEGLAKTADGFNVDFINSLNSTMTNTATIDGKTIAQLEKEGKYYDYKFVSREQFENMGFFKKEKLEQFGFIDDEAGTAISKMEDHLRKYGTVDIFDRYPNTRTGSMAPSITFLGDDTLTQNQSKISVSLAMKANADYDGDSGSNFLLKYTDSKGREIDASYYKRVESIAIENLEKEGREISANSISEAAEATGMIFKEDFENFSKLQAQMSTAAMSENQRWAQEGKKIITKDSIKNIKIGDISKAAMVEDGYSDFLSTNVFSRLSQMPKIDDFYETEKNAMEVINQAKALNEGHDIVKNLFKSGSKDEIKEWDKFLNMSDIREENSSVMMDKALAILENAKSNGHIKDDYLEFAKSTAVKRIGHDKYVQEMMAKTGLAATGNVNLSLNSIKLATQFTEADPSKIAYTNFIWEGLDVAEQGIISDKKRTNPGYDDTRIEGFTEAIREIYEKRQFTTGKEKLSIWMDENGGNVFETVYDEMGQYLLKDDYKKLSKEQGIKQIKKDFLDHAVNTAQNDRFMSIKATFDLIGRNGNHDNNLYNAIPTSLNENFLRANTMEAVELTNESRSKAVWQSSLDQAERQLKHAANQAKYEEGMERSVKDMTRSVSTEAASNVMKHVPKISMGGGSGIGKAMIGLAAGLLVSGYASGNPLKDKPASEVAEGQQMQPPPQTMSVPQFMDQGGMVTGNNQMGYVINLQADTKKGRKYMKRMMAQAAQASVGGAVSVNMNLRDASKGQITDSDIENYMNRYL